jgi:hypothetical protein
MAVGRCEFKVAEITIGRLGIPPHTSVRILELSDDFGACNTNYFGSRRYWSRPEVPKVLSATHQWSVSFILVVGGTTVIVKKGKRSKKCIDYASSTELPRYLRNELSILPTSLANIVQRITIVKQVGNSLSGPLRPSAIFNWTEE